MENANFVWPWVREHKRQKHSARAKKAWITRRQMLRARKGLIGRPKLYTEMTIARLPEGSLQRIDLILKHGESQAAFVREAIEQALQAREADQ